MQNKKLITLVILGTMAVFSLIYGMRASSRKNPALKPSAVIRKEGALPVEIDEAAVRIRRAKRSSYESFGRNPFVLDLSSSGASSSLVLNGIMYDKKCPQAIINGEVVGIGATVGGKRVVDIKEDRVILNDGSKDFELRLDQ